MGKSLQEKLEGVVADNPATFGVVVKHLDTHEEARINDSSYFQLASTFKVPILAALFRDAEAGRLSLAQRVRLEADDRVPGSGVLKEFDVGAEVSLKDLAMLMIIVSDNLGTDKVLEFVGIERVDAYMKELDLRDISIKYSCWDLLSLGCGMEVKQKNAAHYQELNRQLEKNGVDETSVIFQPIPENNVATPKDMSRLLELIATKKLGCEETCDGILAIMKRQQLRNRIPYLLPDTTVVACKSGTIGSVVNDVGIVYLPQDRGAFTIAALSTGNQTRSEGERTIARLARTAYEHFLDM
ncbi:MAG: serine hydrolase [Clostridia bacterium]